MAMGSLFILPMLLLSSIVGGGNEVLHYVDTDTYWALKSIDPTPEVLLGKLADQAKAPDVTELAKQLGHPDFKTRREAFDKLAGMGPEIIDQLKPYTKHEDAEVADSARRLIERLGGAGGACKAVMKLMAIRTLGEKKVAAAKDRLQELTTSTEPFVADYARVALARIAGEKPKFEQLDDKALQADLSLLPEHCGVVGQFRLKNGPKVDLDALWNIAKVNPMIGQQVNRDRFFRIATEGALALAERVGNLRLEGATFGVSKVLNDRESMVVLVLRGSYDRGAVRRAIAAEAGDDLRSEVIEGIEVIGPEYEDEVKLMLPSATRFVFIKQERQDPPAEKLMAGALKTGKGTLHKNAEMMKLLETVDRKAPLWVACTVTGSYREVPPLKPLQTVAGYLRPEKDDLALSVAGVAETPEGAAEAERAMNRPLGDLRQVAPMLRGMGMGGAVDLVESLKLKRAGSTVGMTARMPRDKVPTLGLLPMMYMVGMREHDRVGPALEPAPEAPANRGF